MNNLSRSFFVYICVKCCRFVDHTDTRQVYLHVCRRTDKFVKQFDNDKFDKNGYNIKLPRSKSIEIDQSKKHTKKTEDR